MKYLRLSILTLILAIALASLTSYNVSAIQPVFDISKYERVAYDTGRRNCYFSDGTTADSVWNCDITKSNFYIRRMYSVNPVNLKKGDIIEFYVFEYNTTNFALMFDTYFGNLNAYNNATLMDFQKVDASYYHTYYPDDSLIPDGYYINNIYKLTYIQQIDQNSQAIGIGSNNNLNVFGGTAANNQWPSGLVLRYTLNNISVYRRSSTDPEQEIADTLTEEHNKTIQDEQTASSGAGGFSFNFSLPNPFSIFQVSDGCVSTPIIDSWLHLEGDWKSPHCPVIPDNVRNILTPVVTLIVTLATLLVVIRWVSSSAVDVAGNSVALNDKPQKGGK